MLQQYVPYRTVEPICGTQSRVGQCAWTRDNPLGFGSIRRTTIKIGEQLPIASRLHT